MDQNKNQGQQQKRPQVPPERGSGGRMERNRSTGTDRSPSGISNRPMDEELDAQEELPERGERQSER